MWGKNKSKLGSRSKGYCWAAKLNVTQLRAAEQWAGVQHAHGQKTEQSRLHVLGERHFFRCQASRAMCSTSEHNNKKKILNYHKQSHEKKFCDKVPSKFFYKNIGYALR
jgi:hypothetical protein